MEAVLARLSQCNQLPHMEIKVVVLIQQMTVGLLASQLLQHTTAPIAHSCHNNLFSHLIAIC